MAGKSASDKATGCLVLLVIIGAVAIWRGIVGIESSKQAATMPKDPVALAEKVIGVVQKSDGSGIVDASQDGNVLIVNYRYFPVASDYEYELGIALAKKLRQILLNTTAIDSIIIVAYAPYDDMYGNRKWLPKVGFEVDREVMARINWDNFLEGNLLKVAKNVKQFR